LSFKNLRQFLIRPSIHRILTNSIIIPTYIIPTYIFEIHKVPRLRVRNGGCRLSVGIGPVEGDDLLVLLASFQLSLEGLDLGVLLHELLLHLVDEDVHLTNRPLIIPDNPLPLLNLPQQMFHPLPVKDIALLLLTILRLNLLEE